VRILRKSSRTRCACSVIDQISRIIFQYGGDAAHTASYDHSYVFRVITGGLKSGVFDGFIRGHQRQLGKPVQPFYFTFADRYFRVEILYFAYGIDTDNIRIESRRPGVTAHTVFNIGPRFFHVQANR
jgi:hypothetical protein